MASTEEVDGDGEAGDLVGPMQEELMPREEKEEERWLLLLA